MRTNIQAVSDVLAERGATTLFGLIGNGNLHFVADMVDRCGARYVGVRHENAAVAAADGYARAGGTVGFATVTHGPGFTNALTALVTALRARTPLLLIAGSAMGYPHRSTQRLDQGAVASALGIPVVAPSADGDWAEAARDALRRAASGTVLLDIPAEATRRPARCDSGPERSPPAARPSPDPEAVDRIVQVLMGTERLLVLAGRGAVRAGVRDQLVALGRRYGARFGTTLAAKGLFSRLDGDIGIVGGLAKPASWAACRECDVVLVAGASLNGFTTEHATLFRSARVIRLDEDAAAPSTLDVHLTLCCGLAESVAAILAASRPGTRPPWDPGTAEAQAVRTAATLWPSGVLQHLDRILPDARTVVFDHGDRANGAVPYFRAADPSQSLFMPDFGSLGLSLAAAVGASIACPERRTVAILGDGGLMMSLSELDTIKRTGAPDLIVVLNDGVYGAEYPHLAEIGASLGPATFASAPPSEIARAIGIPSIRLGEGDDFGALDGLVAVRGGPMLVEVACPPPATKHD